MSSPLLLWKPEGKNNACQINQIMIFSRNLNIDMLFLISQSFSCTREIITLKIALFSMDFYQKMGKNLFQIKHA